MSKLFLSNTVWTVISAVFLVLNTLLGPDTRMGGFWVGAWTIVFAVHMAQALRDLRDKRLNHASVNTESGK